MNYNFNDILLNIGIIDKNQEKAKWLSKTFITKKNFLNAASIGSTLLYEWDENFTADEWRKVISYQQHNKPRYCTLF